MTTLLPMTGTVTLSDRGQSYIEFDILDDLITAVRPSGRPGWINTKVNNLVFLIGGQLIIELHNGYQLALEQPIVRIFSTPR